MNCTLGVLFKKFCFSIEYRNSSDNHLGVHANIFMHPKLRWLNDTFLCLAGRHMGTHTSYLIPHTMHSLENRWYSEMPWLIILLKRRIFQYFFFFFFHFLTCEMPFTSSSFSKLISLHVPRLQACPLAWKARLMPFLWWWPYNFISVLSASYILLIVLSKI